MGLEGRKNYACKQIRSHLPVPRLTSLYISHKNTQIYSILKFDSWTNITLRLPPGLGRMIVHVCQFSTRNRSQS